MVLGVAGSNPVLHPSLPLNILFEGFFVSSLPSALRSISILKKAYLYRLEMEEKVLLNVDHNIKANNVEEIARTQKLDWRDVEQQYKGNAFTIYC